MFQSFQGINNALISIYFIFVVCLNVGWLIHCADVCVKIIKKYRVCQHKPNLHPIYRDVQYLSQQRKLYNLETHFVKNLLMLLCIAVELIYIFWFEVLGIANVRYSREYSKYNSTIIAIEAKYPNCYIHSTMKEFYFFPFAIILRNIESFIFVLLFFLLSILTRYLAARYLNHPFNRTLRKYIIWLSVQFIIIVACSTLYTVIISFVLCPVLLVINWFVLLKDSQFLSRVLKSNLIEIELHTNNKFLLKEQLSAYKFYRFFQKLMFFSLSVLILGLTSLKLYYFVLSFYDSFCLLNIIYGIDISATIPRFSQDKNEIEVYLYIFCYYILVLSSICSSFPLLSITLLPIIRECVKRYKSRHYVYRYNYDNIYNLIN